MISLNCPAELSAGRPPRCWPWAFFLLHLRACTFLLHLFWFVRFFLVPVLISSLFFQLLLTLFFCVCGVRETPSFVTGFHFSRSFVSPPSRLTHNTADGEKGEKRGGKREKHNTIFFEAHTRAVRSPSEVSRRQKEEDKRFTGCRWGGQSVQIRR